MLQFSDDNLWRYATLQVVKEHFEAISKKLDLPATTIDRETLGRMKDDLDSVTKFVSEATALNSGMEHFDPPFAPVAKYLQDLLLPSDVRLRYFEQIDKADTETLANEAASEVSKILHSIAGTAVSIVLNQDSPNSIFAALSNVVADHLAYLQQWTAENKSLGDKEQVRLQSVVTELRQSNTSCSYENWLTTFKKVVQSHLDVAGAAQEKQKAQEENILQLRELGNNLMANLSYPQAIKVYTTAIDSCSIFSANNLAQLYTNRAIAFIGLNCYPEAIQDLKQAIARDRTFVPAYAQLGYCELYMGCTLNALRCYKNALDALAGNIDPPSTNLDFQQKEEYKSAMARSAFPQFVHKLVQAIILTEKRAKQQRVSLNDIRFYMTEIKKTLAELRIVADPEDQHLFEYTYDESFEQVRSTAARANQQRPSVLTPEVAQDIMAGTLMETIAIPMPSFPGFPRRRETGNTANAAPNTNAAQANPANPERSTEGTASPLDATTQGAPRQDASVRSLMNQLGDIFGEMMQAQTLNYFPNDPPANEERPTPIVDVRVETFPATIPTLNVRNSEQGAQQNNATSNDRPTTASSETSAGDGDTASRSTDNREEIPMSDLSNSLNQMIAGDYQPMFNTFMNHFVRNGGSDQGDQPNIFRSFFQRASETQTQARNAQNQPARSETQQSDESMPDAPDVD